MRAPVPLSACFGPALATSWGRWQCTPLNRTWPGQRCDRCVLYGYTCSANFRANETSRKARTDGQQGHRPPSDIAQDAPRTGQLAQPAQDDADQSSRTESSHDGAASTLASHAFPPTQDQVPCFRFFRLLHTVGWSFARFRGKPDPIV